MEAETTGCWDLMFDWVQPYQTCKYSTCIVAIRCASFNEEDKAKVGAGVGGRVEVEGLDNER